MTDPRMLTAASHLALAIARAVALDGGRAAAYTHPLYLQAGQRAENLRDELRGLI